MCALWTRWSADLGSFFSWRPPRESQILDWRARSRYLPMVSPEMGSLCSMVSCFDGHIMSKHSGRKAILTFSLAAVSINLLAMAKLSSLFCFELSCTTAILVPASFDDILQIG